MELQQLRYVVAVAETRNFTRAAERCFVVQSALSHQIKSLEAELGFTLFARTSRRVDLTPAGLAFLPAARACLQEAERAVDEAAAALGQVRGRLRLGVIPTVVALDIPATLAAFHERHPAVNVSLHVAGSDEIVAQIADGTLDVGVIGLPDEDYPRGVQSQELARERHQAFLPRSHPQADAPMLSLADLAGERFADFREGTPGRAQSDRAFAAAGLNREVAFEAMTVDLILGLVAHGLTCALLPIAPPAGLDGVVAIPLRDGPTRVEHLVWSDFNPSPAATAFLRYACVTAP